MKIRWTALLLVLAMLFAACEPSHFGIPTTARPPNSELSTKIYLATAPEPWFPWLHGKTDIVVGEIYSAALVNQRIIITFTDGAVLGQSVFRAYRVAPAPGCSVLALKVLNRGRRLSLVALRPCNAEDRRP